MGNKTVKGMASAIVKAGGGESLIVKALDAVHAQGYASGYGAGVSDMRKAKDSKKRVASKGFKKEIDIIDDVMKSKWA